MTRTVARRLPETDAAVRYAWWLTGDDAAARAAVERAAARPGVQARSPRPHLPALLAAVRAEAITAPTMCPASELALLHDVHGLALDEASRLAGIDPDDACVELAHGRLEALLDEPPQPFAHPARLGGLAVGNPPDVAHARQCASCGNARRLRLRGREELRTLAERSAPAEVVSAPAADVDRSSDQRREPGSAPPARVLHPLLWVGALTVALVTGATVAAAPTFALVAVAALALAVGVALHPPLAAYTYLAATPLIVGIDRGSLIPLLRPNEALVAVLAAGLLMHGVARMVRNGGLRTVIRPTPIDAAFLFLAFSGSVLPLLWLVARDQPLTQDDLLYSITLWKYFGVFVLVRVSVRTEPQVRRCLWLAMGAAAVVALIAILQSMQWLGVPELLATYYSPFGDEGALEINRGTSTISSATGAASVMTFMLAVALMWLLRGSRHRPLLLATSALFVLGTLASGQFAGLIALVVCVVVVGLVSGRLARVALAAVPSAALGLIILRPVVERRLSGIDPRQGVPTSWLGRLHNLRTHFWPELFTDFNWVFGVQPSPRVPASDSWRDWIWIESGHTWLLWIGGVPFLLAFVVFMWVAIRAVTPIARGRSDAIGVAAVGSLVSLWAVTLLMTLDPHLTLRGSADLTFALLALALTAYGGSRASKAAGEPGVLSVSAAS